MRRFLYRFVAGLSAMVTLFIFLLGPMYLFRIYHGIGLDAKGPDGEIWYLVVGGGIGAGMARLVHHWLFCSIGGYSEYQESKAWGREN
ncbi:hypothetical protein [Microbulbifer taiwanensis]|uniref:ABC transporter permease n=1 Tax=Microbulbifer taiwanensis TaxID=986746 RepID=A0ABW1YNU4_9GAMM|nr:hypothetical protein [Microbulbifer taiwanensis]